MRGAPVDRACVDRACVDRACVDRACVARGLGANLLAWASAFAGGIVAWGCLSTGILGCDLPLEVDSPGGPVVLDSDPGEGEVDVDRGVVFRAWLDRAVYPRDVHRGHVSVQSGSRGVFLAPSFDPIDRVLVLRNAGVPLDPAVVYRLRVDGIRDLDGNTMAAPFEIAFRTGELAGTEPTPAPVDYARVAPILEGCAALGCHSADAPALGLDLSSPEGIRTTAIGVVAEQTRVGTQGERPWHGAASLDGLALIDVVGGVGRPARSYLLYKVLGESHTGGDRMPPEPDPPLDPAALRTLSDWILAGAPTG